MNEPFASPDTRNHDYIALLADTDQPHVGLEHAGNLSDASSAVRSLDEATRLPDVAEKRDSGHGTRHDSGHADATGEMAPSRSNSTRKSLRSRVKSLGHRAKEKTERLKVSAKIHAGFANEAVDETSPQAELYMNPAFDPHNLIEPEDLSVGGKTDRFLGAMKVAGQAIIHPGSAAKREAANAMAVSDRPYLSQEADLEYLNAHADLSEARSDQSNTSDEGRAGLMQAKVDHLDDVRDSRKVAWVTSHHIKRVMVVPKVEPPEPVRDDYYIVDEETGQKFFDWRGYTLAKNWAGLKSFALNRMGNVDFAPQSSFDQTVMLSLVQRILIATSSWQSWIVSLRKLYRWEDPRETGKWALIWGFVFYMDYCVTFVMCYIVFITLENKFRPKNVERLRASYERAVDGGQEAFRLNELFSRHGSEEWLQPLIDTAGPMIQLQLSDTADFLEVLHNFYDWKVPEKTWATLFWFATAILIGILTDTGYSVKIVWMFVYLFFFVSRPVASKAPEYRHAVNSLRWIFWDIPTDSEWSMMYLRRHAQDTRERLIASRVEAMSKSDIDNPLAQIYGGAMHVPASSATGPVEDPDASHDSDGDSWHSADASTSVLSGLDLASFRCRSQHARGRLIIFSDGLRFERSSTLRSSAHHGTETWRHGWLELTEMRKASFGSIGAKTEALGLGTGTDGLELHFSDDSIVELHSIKGMDRAFNCILGFSGLRFQVLQPVVEKERKGEGSAPGGKKTADSREGKSKGARSGQGITQGNVEGAVEREHPLEKSDT